jgi:EAL domain-containing protein (putative c-di-GMP-specific phosphodiesterase class I)
MTDERADPPDGGAIPAEDNAPRLLIIDDEEGFLEFVGRVARMAGFVPLTTSNPADFHSLLMQHQPAVVVVDLKMPEIDGIEILRALSVSGSPAQVLVASGEDARVLQAVEKLGRERQLNMAGMLQKPVRAADLKQKLEALRPKEEPVSQAALAAAIQTDQLVLHYQPRVDLQSNRYMGAEALVRWHHPTKGLLPPAAFIPLCERTHLIGELTDWVVQRAISDCAAWRKAGLDLGVAINLSPRSIRSLDLPDMLQQQCREAAIDSGLVTLELTETATSADLASLIDVLTRFRLKGFQLAMDDFGTGYSSLVQLVRLPFTELKIDRSFVDSMLSSPESASVVDITIELSRRLKLLSTAEGVENAETAGKLRELGCEHAQGFGLCKPLPVQDMMAFVVRHHDGRRPPSAQGAA